MDAQRSRDAVFRTRAQVSPRRYVCTTCHVEQTDAKPLDELSGRRSTPWARLQPPQTVIVAALKSM